MRGKPYLGPLRDKEGNIVSPYWYIYWYEGRGRRKSTGYRIGQEDHAANLALSAFTLEREKPTAREPDKLMLAQALKDYYDEHAQYIATAKHAKYHEARLLKGLNVIFVSQITQGGVNAYIRECQKREESNGTIRRDLEHLKAALNHEVREQRLIYAPKFKMPAPPQPRERILTQAETKKLLKHCKSDHLKNFIQIMLNTGQRPGAVENLTWFQVDFANRIIHFDRTGKQQTNKRARPVAMNAILYKLLCQLFKKKKKTGYVLEYKEKHAGNVKKAFARAANAAGLDISRYTLRHTVLDRVNDHADDKTASDIGGHTNTRTTQRNYIKSKMEKQRVVLEGLWK